MNDSLTLRSILRWATAATVGLYFGLLGDQLLRRFDPYVAVGTVFGVWLVLAVIVVGLGTLRWWRGLPSRVENGGEMSGSRRKMWESWLKSGFSGRLTEASGTAAIAGLAATAPHVEGAYWQVFVALLMVAAVAALVLVLWDMSPALGRIIRLGGNPNGGGDDRSDQCG